MVPYNDDLLDFPIVEGWGFRCPECGELHWSPDEPSDVLKFLLPDIIYEVERMNRAEAAGRARYSDYSLAAIHRRYDEYKQGRRRDPPGSRAQHIAYKANREGQSNVDAVREPEEPRQVLTKAEEEDRAEIATQNQPSGGRRDGQQKEAGGAFAQAAHHPGIASTPAQSAQAVPEGIAHQLEFPRLDRAREEE